MTDNNNTVTPAHGPMVRTSRVSWRICSRITTKRSDRLIKTVRFAFRAVKEISLVLLFVDYAWQLEFRFNSNFHLISISVPGKTTQVKVNMLIRSMGPISEMKMVKIRTHFLYLTFKIFEFCGNVWQALKDYFFYGVMIQNCNNELFRNKSNTSGV